MARVERTDFWCLVTDKCTKDSFYGLELSNFLFSFSNKQSIGEQLAEVGVACGNYPYPPFYIKNYFILKIYIKNKYFIFKKSDLQRILNTRRLKGKNRIFFSKNNYSVSNLISQKHHLALFSCLHSWCLYTVDFGSNWLCLPAKKLWESWPWLKFEWSAVPWPSAGRPVLSSWKCVGKPGGKWAHLPPAVLPNQQTFFFFFYFKHSPYFWRAI